ncbi:MAG: substrate-binding domain-containing protein [Phreatobacter sp.]
MKFATIAMRCLALAMLALLSLASPVQAAEIKVMNSGGFTAAYRELLPAFERASGHSVVTSWGASMGTAPDAIPVRLARGEAADIVILAASGLENLIRQGKVDPASRVDLARSSIGMVVRAGAPRPDISSVEALRKALLEARSIAYSASASGVYISTELYQRLGVVDQVGPKSRRILSERVGSVVARGDAEIGFQQISELLPIQGIDFVGPLPAELQRVTVFSAGILVDAREPEAARQLIGFLASPAARETVTRTGLEPIPAIEKRP